MASKFKVQYIDFEAIIKKHNLLRAIPTTSCLDAFHTEVSLTWIIGLYKFINLVDPTKRSARPVPTKQMAQKLFHYTTAHVNITTKPKDQTVAMVST